MGKRAAIFAIAVALALPSWAVGSSGALDCLAYCLQGKGGAPPQAAPREASGPSHDHGQAAHHPHAGALSDQGDSPTAQRLSDPSESSAGPVAAQAPPCPGTGCPLGPNLQAALGSGPLDLLASLSFFPKATDDTLPASPEASPPLPPPQA